MSGRSLGRGLVIATAVAVAATVVAAVAVIGSPSAQRQARLDERRVRDLRQLEAAVEVYATRDGRLPGSVEMLGPATGRDLSLVDPVSRAPYAYEPRDARRYRLCADFGTDTRAQDRRGLPVDAGWRHPAGRHCFERAVPADALEPAATK